MVYLPHVDEAHPVAFVHLQEPFEVGMLLFAIVSAGGCRFWLSRMRHPGWSLLPYLLGIFFAYLTPMYGIFLFRQLPLIFFVLGAVLFCLYFPIFVHLRPTPPPIQREG